MTIDKDMLYDASDQASKRLKFKFPYDIRDWIENRNMVIENYHRHDAMSNFYTTADSATTPEQFIKYSENYGCQLMFSTQHGFQGPWMEIYDLCKKSELKFRYGAEAYWVKDKDKVFIEEYEDKKHNKKTRELKDRTNCHMVLIARNYTGVRKLNYILSEAAQNGFYYRPRIDLNLLFTLSPEDVYVTSACIAGWLYPDAEEVWLKIWKHFGDSFFLEYQANNTEKQKELNSKIYRMSKQYGIQTIIGLDTHYLNDEDRIKRENLLQRKKISYPEEEGWYMDFPMGTVVLKRMQEQDVIPLDEIIYSMMNTHVFVNGCEDFELDTDFKIPIEPRLKDYTYEERAKILQEILNSQYLKEQNKSKERVDGVRYEFGEIYGSGTVDYFIDNYDIVKLATSPEYGGQLTPTSRGSAASYYCSKLLGFTTIDRFEVDVPIYPQRFITKDRILSSHQMPDIDLNISKQEPFVEASRAIFGEQSCYPLLAIGTLGEKSGFKLYASINGIEPSVANEISKFIDQYNEALKQADEDEQEDIHIEDFIKDPEYLRIFNESKPYQGIPENSKVHACGHVLFNGNIRQKDVVGYGDIRYEIGLMRCHSESTGKSVVVACVEGSLLDSYGYVKDDFLIVDVVSIIYKLYNSIGMKVPSTTELRKMVQDDSDTWKLYEIGASCCLNQCEKASTTRKAMQYKPKSIKELSAFIAGIRPGFKSHIDNFLAREPYTNGEPAIDELLSDCFNYMIYQEAVMKIFGYLGIPMKDSYDTIKKISKKKLKGDALKHVEDTLKEHWFKNIGNTDNFDPVYQVVKDSARYAFNAPHAWSMSLDSLYEAWMKAHHTSKFYEVTLNHYADKGDKNKVAKLEEEARRFFGFKIGSYGYGQDNSKFHVDDETRIIYPSLASVKGIGIKAVEDLYQISKNGYDNFVDIYIATANSNINKTVFTNLIKIGYFEKFGSIKKLLREVDIVDEWSGSSWKGRKVLSKTELNKYNLTVEEIRRFASDVTPKGNISNSRYTITDWKGIAKLLASKVSDDEFPLSVLIKFQIDILQYVEYKNPNLSKSYVAVTNLDTIYSPKFSAYCLQDGQIAEMKIHKKLDGRDKRIKKSFADTPVSNGDIIKIKDCKKEPKKRKGPNGWEPVPGLFDWWIKDYCIVNTL